MRSVCPHVAHSPSLPRLPSHCAAAQVIPQSHLCGLPASSQGEAGVPVGQQSKRKLPFRLRATTWPHGTCIYLGVPLLQLNQRPPSTALLTTTPSATTRNTPPPPSFLHLHPSSALVFGAQLVVAKLPPGASVYPALAQNRHTCAHRAWPVCVSAAWPTRYSLVQQIFMEAFQALF